MKVWETQLAKPIERKLEPARKILGTPARNFNSLALTITRLVLGASVTSNVSDLKSYLIESHSIKQTVRYHLKDGATATVEIGVKVDVVAPSSALITVTYKIVKVSKKKEEYNLGFDFELNVS